MNKTIDGKFDLQMIEISKIEDNLVRVWKDIADIREASKKKEEAFLQMSKESMEKYQTIAQNDLKYESTDYEQRGQADTLHSYSHEPRMFSMNQLRDLIYIHLNRSTLKQLVYMNMSDCRGLRTILTVQEKADQELHLKIEKEKVAMTEKFEKLELEEKENRIKISNIVSDVMYKLNVVIKEVKASNVTVKQGENSIELMKDKVEKFRVQNVKFQEATTYKVRDLERSFDSSVKKIDEDLMDLQNKVYDQLSDQRDKFDEILANNKETVVSELQEDIEAGQSKIKELRDEFTSMLDQLVEELERKHGRQANKLDTFTLGVENKFQRMNKEMSKLNKDFYKLQVQGPSGAGINVQNNIQQASNEQHTKLKTFNAKLFSLETQTREIEIEIKAQVSQLRDVMKKLVTTFEQVQMITTQQDRQAATPIRLKASPFSHRHYSSKNGGGNTQFLPKVKDGLNETNVIFFGSQDKSGEKGLDKGIQSGIQSSTIVVNDSKMTSHKNINNQSATMFEPLFYQRLHHIMRVLDEDALELAKVKTYFNSISQAKNSKLDITLLENLKKSRVSDIFQGTSGLVSKDLINISNTMPVEDQQTNFLTTLDNTQNASEEKIAKIKSPNKVMDKSKSSRMGQNKSLNMEDDMVPELQAKQISLKGFNEMKFGVNNYKHKTSSTTTTPRDEIPQNQLLKTKGLIETFEQEWKIDENIKNMRNSFKKRLRNHSHI